MVKFFEGQLLKYRVQGGLDKGDFRICAVIPTPQGGRNLKIQNLKTKTVPVCLGAGVIERDIENNKCKLREEKDVKKSDLEKGKITGSSRWAENEVKKYIHRSGDSPDISDGDVWKRFYMDEDDTSGAPDIIKMEIKSPNSSDIKNKREYQVNQARPMKYHIIIAVVKNLSGFNCDCIVYPARTVLIRALTMMGQHTPDSLAVFGFSCKPSHQSGFGCSFEDLNDRVRIEYIEDHYSVEGKKTKSIADERMGHYYKYVIPRNKKSAEELGLCSVDVFSE